MAGPNVLLLDGYVDEPSALGVPPYMSPHARYCAGALWDAGCSIQYRTIDQWRAGGEPRELAGECDILAVLWGAVVPGKYLRGAPVSARELSAISEIAGPKKVVGGPAVGSRLHGSERPGVLAGFDAAVAQDFDAGLFDWVSTGDAKGRRRTAAEWSRWSVLGAKSVIMHPDYPLPLTAEVDTSRGCVRYQSGGCSFCCEPQFGRPVFRTPEEVAAEVAALHGHGVRAFRIGGQSCIFSYATKSLGSSDAPRPDPDAVERLFAAIGAAAPDARVLHVDNANPAVIARYPDESRAIARSLVAHCTSGNVVAFGLESADPAVREANNLNATADETLAAVRLVNEEGAGRGPSGLPALLPGINLIAGLDGETKDTYRLNLEFLRRVLDGGLMVRRINIRQVAAHRRDFSVRVDHSAFLRFKNEVRETIDRPMLRRVAPTGTILKDVYLEVYRESLTMGRQLGSYPLLVGMPYQTDVSRFTDVWVTDHGFRSITAVEHPFPVNRASLKALQALPGVGKKRAARLARARPFGSDAELARALEDDDAARKLGGKMDYSEDKNGIGHLFGAFKTNKTAQQIKDEMRKGWGD